MESGVAVAATDLPSSGGEDDAPRPSDPAAASSLLSPTPARRSRAVLAADPMSSSGEESPPPSDPASIAVASSSSSPAPAKRSRRVAEKRAVLVPIAAAAKGGNAGGVGEWAAPPADEWAWRKYGQKPIKGSPYPRGYYRCSSSKSCPARKQVERSRVDPTALLITYSFDHNHPFPSSRSDLHRPISASITTCSLPQAQFGSIEPNIPADPMESGPPIDPGSIPPSARPVLAHLGPMEPDIADLIESGLVDGQYWLGLDDGPTLESILCGPVFGFSDVGVPREEPRVEVEDDALFAGLGELPECAVMFRREAVAVPTSVGKW